MIATTAPMTCQRYGRSSPQMRGRRTRMGAAWGWAAWPPLSGLTIAPSVAAQQLPIAGALGHQLGVRPLLDDLSVVQYRHAIGDGQRGRPVRHHQRRVLMQA